MTDKGVSFCLWLYLTDQLHDVWKVVNKYKQKYTTLCTSFSKMLYYWWRKMLMKCIRSDTKMLLRPCTIMMMMIICEPKRRNHWWFVEQTCVNWWEGTMWKRNCIVASWFVVDEAEIVLVDRFQSCSLLMWKKRFGVVICTIEGPHPILNNKDWCL